MASVTSPILEVARNNLETVSHHFPIIFFDFGGRQKQLRNSFPSVSLNSEPVIAHVALPLKVTESDGK